MLFYLILNLGKLDQKSDLNVGTETLSIIDYIDNLNTKNFSVINKNSTV